MATHHWLPFFVLWATYGGALALQGTEKCTPQKCVPPGCVCSAENIPYANWTVQETPQMIIVVFEGSVNDVTYSTYYQPLFQGIKNPNGCPLAATYFISHKYTDYALVHDIWSLGNDISPQSITGQAWNYGMNTQTIYNEVAGEKYYLQLYAGIPDVQGMRAPAAQPAGDKQFTAGVKAELAFDATMTSRKYNSPFWPYTLDFQTTQDCLSGTCPIQSYPGFWEFPVTSFIDGNGLLCSNLFSCAYNNSMNDAYSLLKGNFAYHKPQATPFVVIVPLPWLYNSNNSQGLDKFLKETVADSRTYVVTLQQALAWLQKPVTVAELATFKPWGCAQPRPKTCSKQSCSIKFNGETINFNFCTSTNATMCPLAYPWVDNLPWITPKRIIE